MLKWVAIVLLPLLLAMGFTPGPQLTQKQAEEAARYTPETQQLLSHPTVKTSALYQSGSDTWDVTLTETVSGTQIAALTVEDDTGVVSNVDIYPAASSVTYPKTSKDQAIKLASANPKVQSELSKFSSHTTDASYSKGMWLVHFWTGEGDSQREVAQVEVNDETWQLNYVWIGDQVAWQMARGESAAYGKQVNYWYVWGPLALVFALAFLRTDKTLSLRNLDILALLGFLISHAYFRQGESYPAVLWLYPPMIYLFLRTLLMGFGVGERVQRTSSFPAPALFALGAIASGFVIALNLDSRVIDVGYAGVVGADRILHGQIPYGNMPSDVGTGDTYGPLNYLIYTPFTWIMGWSGHWDYLPPAHAVTIFAFLVTAMALIVAGWRLSGPKGAGALFLAWAVFPYTIYTTNNNTNDVLVAAVGALGLAAYSSPAARGASIAAGFAIKLFPLLLAPLWVAYDGAKLRPLIKFILGGVAVVAASFWILALGGDPVRGLKLFYEKTVAYQNGRDTPWTIFTQIPQTRVLQLPLTGAVLFLAALVTYVPKKITMRRLAALSAALIIGFQLTLNYWFYPYITWFEPFIFMALLLATNPDTALDSAQEEPTKKKQYETSDLQENRVRQV